MKANEYKCAVCHGVFTKIDDETWNDEKALAETVGLFGGDALNDDLGIVCDDCFRGLPIAKEKP